MIIRTATLADLEQIAAVEAKCFPVAEAATIDDFNKIKQEISHLYRW